MFAKMFQVLSFLIVVGVILWKKRVRTLLTIMLRTLFPLKFFGKRVSIKNRDEKSDRNLN